MLTSLACGVSVLFSCETFSSSMFLTSSWCCRDFSSLSSAVVLASCASTACDLACIPITQLELSASALCPVSGVVARSGRQSHMHARIPSDAA